MLGGRFVILTYLGSYGPWIFPRNAQLAWALYKLDDNLAKTLSEPSVSEILKNTREPMGSWKSVGSRLAPVWMSLGHPKASLWTD